MPLLTHSPHLPHKHNALHLRTCTIPTAPTTPKAMYAKDDKIRSKAVLYDEGTEDENGAFPLQPTG